MEWVRNIVGQERTAGMEIDRQGQTRMGQQDKDGNN